MASAIFFTGDLLRECAFSSRTSAFDQVRRLVRLARLLAISPSRNTATATLSIAGRREMRKTVVLRHDQTAKVLADIAAKHNNLPGGHRGEVSYVVPRSEDIDLNPHSPDNALSFGVTRAIQI
jgi:hypothetical protein